MFSFHYGLSDRAEGLSNAKCSYIPQRGAKPAQCEKRNKWQGPAPPGGKDAVYVGFDLEQAQRSATRLEPANNLATQNSEEPFFFL